MANELTFNGTLSFTKGYLTLQKNITNTVSVSGTNSAGAAQSIGTTEEALALVDVATAGWAVFRNCDATNYIEIGVKPVATFYPFAKLKPGEWFVMRLGTNSPYAKANTATAILDWEILPD